MRYSRDIRNSWRKRRQSRSRLLKKSGRVRRTRNQRAKNTNKRPRTERDPACMTLLNHTRCSLSLWTHHLHMPHECNLSRLTFITTMTFILVYTGQNEKLHHQSTHKPVMCKQRFAFIFWLLAFYNKCIRRLTVCSWPYSLHAFSALTGKIILNALLFNS